MVTRKHNGFWNYESCYNEALKYKSRGEYAKGNQSAYNKANANGWLDDYTWFSESASKKKWDKQTCEEEARKYTTKSEFRKGNSPAYSVALRNGGLKEDVPILTHPLCYLKRLSDVTTPHPIYCETLL